MRVSPKLLWGAGESKDFSLSSLRDGKVPGDVVADSPYPHICKTVRSRFCKYAGKKVW